jgi:cell division protein FtsI/penicillin-binding protein 2
MVVSKLLKAGTTSPEVINVNYWKQLINTGRWSIVNHSYTHTWWGEDADALEKEIVTSQTILKNLFTTQRVLTYAYPGFSSEKSGLTAAQYLEIIYGPDARELIAPAAVANFGFGQGRLTATPIQIATLISAFANGGGVVTPRLVAGSTEDGTKLKSQTVIYSPKTLFTKSAADTVAKLMISVVEEGSGKNAKPQFGGAGGKTASAQTGQFVDGKETVHAWFSGFYPAEQPRYSIVVLVEGGNSGSDAACPIFAEIANGIGRIEQNRRLVNAR